MKCIYSVGQKTKREDSRTGVTEIKFLRAILNKSKKDKIRNTNRRFSFLKN